MNKIATAYGLGRSRNQDSTGDVKRVFLNPYVNCIHTLVGNGFRNMQVLVVEVYEDDWRG